MGVLLCAATAWAGPASIQGIVKDAQGKPIKGADVRVESRDGKQLFNTAKTDAQGRYIFKVDKGLAAEDGGAQVMKPIPNLDELLTRAIDNGIFGTKMRSVITLPGPGLDAVVEQQFAIARQILSTGLVPIIEPEVDTHSPHKA